MACAAVLLWVGVASAQNEIADENALSGNPASEWDVSGAGDPSIQGFADDISYAPGDTVSFKIDTPALDYRIDVYRLGWYAGLGARKIVELGPSATLPQVQPACLNDAATGLVDCGNWQVSASWVVPANAISGIYLAKLVRKDPEDGRASHVAFVVRDDAGGSEILVQTMDTTWQAYNSYGGNSLYSGSPAGRAYKVSYNRPFTTRGGTPEDWIFNAEYPLVRWLERNGYDVSYSTGVDSDRRAAELLEHEVFVSIGHDEYWSGAQRANVEAARAAGVHLAFLSGNEVFWKTRWEASIDGSGTPHRTLVSYKETHAGAKIDPLPNVWTGTWRDPRPFNPEGAQPENSLTGQIFTVNCCSAAIQVPAADGLLRFWRNTSVAALPPNGVATLPGETLGYEWDEDLADSARPAGALRLSSTTVNVPQRILDFGSNYGPGIATHHLSLYRHASGALVFGAGSVQWSWGLDGSHDRGSNPPDVRMQQATLNLLADMGAQPTTRQAELVAAAASTDATPPSSTIVSPLAGASVSGPIIVSGTALDTGGGIVGGIEVSVDGGATWVPASGRESWSYSFTPTALGSLNLRSRAVDDSGNLETPGPGINVTAVPPSCPCSLWNDTTVPAVISSGDTQAVELGMRFRSDAAGVVTALRFYRSPLSTGPQSARVWTNGGTLLADVSFTGLTASGWQQQALPVPLPIDANTTYVVSYHTTSQYALDQGFFTSGFDNPPLHALANGVDGANGVYAYGPAGSFPTQTFNSSHYWVDVVFEDAPTSYTAFAETTTPPNPAVSDGQPIEIGVKFRSEVPGVVRALRFYKGGANTGVHVGQLFDGAGTLLREATFANETTSGWQEVELSPPAAIAANTTYVAAYHSASGFFAIGAGGLSAGIDRRPLRLLANGEDGGNAVFLYSAVPAFPANSGNGSNYFVDLRFQPDAPFDGDPPAAGALTPANGALNVVLGAGVSAVFDEAIDPTSVTAANFELRDASNALVAASVSYANATRTATLTPNAPLQPTSVHSARLRAGANGIRDVAGNPLAADVTWSFTTAGPPPPPPDEGPGGPILVIGSAADPFGRYLAEILRTEGLNSFTATDISAMNAPLLAAHRVVILGHMALAPAQVTLLSDFVEAGGQLIAIRPDPLLAPLLGLASPAGTLSDAYLQIDTLQAPGTGLVSQTLQFHGAADRWSLAGATALATLYSDATTPTAYPAATLHSVGSNGGSAAAFAYDLNRSIVYTRQGNPAWAGQERDGIAPRRSDDLFFGAAAGDPQPDWIDLSKVAIPQADEQQRFLAGLIRERIGFPLPRFWYFPRMHKAVVILTGDNHGCCGGTTTRFANNLAADPPSCSVADWECVRSTSYIYPGGGLSDAQGQGYHAQGFELGVHINTGCTDWTPASLEGFFASQRATFASQFPSLPAPASNRTHCIAWSDWSTQASVEQTNGMRLDTNYYYWPSGWVADRPGFFTGSGMPMRFAALDGSFIDTYQAVTQLTDESGQTYPFTIDTLLDRAVGAEGYYGAFTANIHTDGATEAIASNVVASAQSRGVPVISARQMLEWLDGRNASSFGSFLWSGGVLSFDVSKNPAARNLRGLLPATRGGAQLAILLRGGAPVPFTLQTLRGIQYAVFAAESGSYSATYAADTTPPVIAGLAASPQQAGSASISWTTDEPATSVVSYGSDPQSLVSQVSSATLTQTHQLSLPGLAPSTVYYYRVSSADASANIQSEPPGASAPASFSTQAAICATDDLRTEFAAGNPGSGSVVVEEQDGEVALQGAVSESFNAAALPAGWSQSPWQAGGGAGVAGGALTVDGALAATDLFFTPGRVLEFQATFGASTFQNVGLGNDLNDRPFVVFGTANTATTLFARTWDAGSVDTPLPGVALGVPHRFRIEWSAAGTLFYVDGTLVATHAGVAANLRPVVSDFNVGGPSVSLDWLRLSPYPASASFDSRIFDAVQSSSWGSTTWTATTPAGTSTALSVRAGNTPTPNASWGAFVPIASQGASAGVAGRYLQYRALLATSDGASSPLLEDVSIACTPAGQVCGNGSLEAPEECDDGGILPGDGCSATCSYESPDADGDGIPNVNETHTGIYVSPTDTGSNPLDADSDDDGFSDGAEVGAGSNPNDAQSFPDGTPPVISSVTAIPQPGGTSAGITWTTNEPATSVVSYGTNPQSLSLEATSGSLVTSHVLLLSDLQPFTTYYFRVRSADAASNLATSPAAPGSPATFDTGQLICGIDDLATDFAAGNPGAAVRVRDADDGEVGLAATRAEDFESGGLPSGWSQTPWQTGGSATVANGALVVDGTLAATDAYFTPGRVLEFVATFGAQAFQHVGFGTDLNDLPFVLLSTGNTTTTLFARTWDAANVDTPLPGVALGVPHRFRIEWSASSTIFYVDGALVATHAGVTASLRPVVSDFNVGGASLAVDWLRLSPFADGGSFFSRVFDAGVESRWDEVDWTATTPSGTLLSISVRAGNTPVPNSQWTLFRPATGGPPYSVPAGGRYAQYSAVLSSSDPSQTPLLEDVTLHCTSQVPGCGNGAIDPGEDCDDGGTISGDGCSIVCAFESQDVDNDGVLNSYETGTGVYLSPTDTGSNPLNPDSDGDGASDGLEISRGSDPNDPGSLPPPPLVPLGGAGSLLLLVSLLTLTAGRSLRR